MELKLILESLLFSAQKPLSVKELRDVLAAAAGHEAADATAKSLARVKESELTAALEQLVREHETAARSYRLTCVAGSWQFVTQPEFGPWLRALVGVKARPPRLSPVSYTHLDVYKRQGYYFHTFNDANTLSAIKLTFITAAIAVPLNCVFGVAAAWAIAKFDFRGKTVLILSLIHIS